MRLILIGYGKMGKLCAQVADEQNHTVSTLIAPGQEVHAARELKAEPIGDVAIDFSLPHAVLDNVKAMARFKKPIVIGTSGWYDQMEEVERIANEAKIGVLWAPNFSLGVNLFMEAVRLTAALFNDHAQYDVAGLECHHRQKKDAPSGTAQALSEVLLNAIERKKQALFTSPNELIQPSTLHFPALRLGTTIGTHEIFFDSSDDTISLKHQAKDRLAYARGAIQAATWLQGKVGFFNFQQMLFAPQEGKR